MSTIAKIDLLYKARCEDISTQCPYNCLECALALKASEDLSLQKGSRRSKAGWHFPITRLWRRPRMPMLRRRLGGAKLNSRNAFSAVSWSSCKNLFCALSIFVTSNSSVLYVFPKLNKMWKKYEIRPWKIWKKIWKNIWRPKVCQVDAYTQCSNANTCKSDANTYTSNANHCKSHATKYKYSTIQCKHTQIQCKSDANLCKKAVPNAEYLLSRPDESSKTVTGVIIEPWPEWTTGGDDDGAPTTHPSWHVPGEQHAQVVNISLGYRSLWQAI